jgi:hypothetical protein
MPYIIETFDKPGSLALRQATQRLPLYCTRSRLEAGK